MGQEWLLQGIAERLATWWKSAWGLYKGAMNSLPPDQDWEQGLVLGSGTSYQRGSTVLPDTGLCGGPWLAFKGAPEPL